MRHKVKKKILGRSSTARKAMIKNLAKSFFENQKVQTTITKAKITKPFIEKLISLGRKDTLQSRRLIIQKIGSNKIASKILKDISPRYKDRIGGYTRITKLKSRQGDGATVVKITLV